MSRYYVNVTGIPLKDLEFMGYNLIKENEDYIFLANKGDHYVLSQHGCRYLYVNDPNDAAILRDLKRIPAPPADEKKKKKRNKD